MALFFSFFFGTNLAIGKIHILFSHIRRKRGKITRTVVKKKKLKRQFILFILNKKLSDKPILS